MYSNTYNKDVKKEDPDIFLITLESTRADHISCYDYHRNTTPNICQMAEDGVVFKNALSQASWTLPSITSLHTSKYPTDIQKLSDTSRLNKSETTLAEHLKMSGYKTYALTAVPYTSKTYNIDQGFDRYIHYKDIDKPAKEIFSDSEEFLKDMNQTFVWFHLPYVHQGYTPHGKFSGVYSSGIPHNVSSNNVQEEFYKMNLSQKDIEYIRARYDEELKYVDHSIGKFIDRLKKLEMYEDSFIMITSDHGEDLMEQGRVGHGLNLYDVLTNIPMIVKFPYGKYKKQEVTKPVGNIDILPTISKLLNRKTPSGTRGVPLQHVIENNTSRKGVISQTSRKMSYTTEDLKIIVRWNSSGHKETEFYREMGHLTEKEDIDSEYNEEKLNEIFGEFSDVYLYNLNGTNTTQEDISMDVEQRLQDLGYRD